jgi:AraC family transcriptional regulator, regulatory protein of adaptative response / methylated-DNA-[protein]-cysteine methyltransferase
MSEYERIEKAIEYIEQNYNRQPELKEIAQNVRLSEYHFQRLFKRWAGISPKKLIQFLTVNRAKQLLEDSRSILDTAFEAGLSGPGRLHDLFITCEAVTPGEYKRRGEGLTVTYGLHDTPFGTCLLAFTDKGISDLNFSRNGNTKQMIRGLKKKWAAAKLKEDAGATKKYIDVIFHRRRPASKERLRIHLRGTNFQIKVWQALLTIPEGCVTSYEDIARVIGKPTASRAVGNAVGDNPIAYLIPCHRVIKKLGEFGNYGGGPLRKKAMLFWENIPQE